MSEWQPIETAPKDGTRILVSDGELVGISRWTDTSREVDVLVSEKGNRRTYESRMEVSGYWDPEGIDVFGPSKWQPLPDPPTQQTAQADKPASKGGV